MKKQNRLRFLILVAASFLFAVARGEPQSLPAYPIDPASITVSGVSSGAYMAHQFHVAHSSTVSGAGILAGGPYNCAGNDYPLNVWKALNQCADFPDLVPFFGPPELAPSIESTKEAARKGAIDNPAHLRNDRVYLFSGTLDEIVPQAVTDVVAAYYREYVETDHVLYVDNVPAGHGMITKDYGGACDGSEPPFFNDCDYDAAGELLRHLYGALSPPGEWLGDGMLAFDQGEFIADPEAHGMHRRGHIYVPADCAAGVRCRLHIAFHGCQQHQGVIADTFYTRSGYNEWAEANNIVILYPQAAPLTTLGLPWPNPAGCWDWWGYTGDDHHLKSGAQVAAVKAMIDRITGGMLMVGREEGASFKRASTNNL
jgi:poly(3-hydroxybutyrate) depolymerase